MCSRAAVCASSGVEGIVSPRFGSFKERMTPRSSPPVIYIVGISVETVLWNLVCMAFRGGDPAISYFIYPGKNVENIYVGVSMAFFGRGWLPGTPLYSYIPSTVVYPFYNHPV